MCRCLPGTGIFLGIVKGFNETAQHSTWNYTHFLLGIDGTLLWASFEVRVWKMKDEGCPQGCLPIIVQKETPTVSAVLSDWESGEQRGKS